MKRRTWLLLGALLVGVLLAVVVYRVLWNLRYEVIERIEYSEPPVPDEIKLVDDRLEDKNPAFDETLVDSRPLGDWEVNKSAAVIRLDCPAIKPDRHAELLVLRPSYADAVRAAAEQHYYELLPSANLLDGVAKQFDDGLYAAVDLACFQGELGLAPAWPELFQAVFDRLPQGSPARPFLAATLELADMQVGLAPDERRRKDALLAVFQADKARSKPISYYTWTPKLEQFLRFSRFLQYEFGPGELDVPREIAAVLEKEPELLDSYRAINRFYAGLTNPLICLSVDALVVACEDIGMRPQFLEDEPVDQEAAMARALAWLENLADDPDLAQDTRVSVPIAISRMRNKTRLWATLGVRLARLEASYARPPKVRPLAEGGPWQDVESYQLDAGHYVIPVDEFAEVKIDGSAALTRDELRKTCDRHQTKEQIIQALTEEQR